MEAMPNANTTRRWVSHTSQTMSIQSDKKESSSLVSARYLIPSWRSISSSMRTTECRQCLWKGTSTSPPATQVPWRETNDNSTWRRFLRVSKRAAHSNKNSAMGRRTSYALILTNYSALGANSTKPCWFFCRVHQGGVCTSVELRTCTRRTALLTTLPRLPACHRPRRNGSGGPQQKRPDQTYAVLRNGGDPSRHNA